MLNRFVLILCLAAAGLQSPATRPAEEAFAAGVAEADLRRYVRELVAFGPRMGGTPSNDKSAA
ncbi:MAG: hypothetical protein M3541_22890, partial [Acidobacteriota bacterium]|nr:hypothetical protein [Acidobacteriota bacterium]